MLEDKDEKEDQGQADAPSCESAGSDSDESIIPRDISAMVLEMEKEVRVSDTFDQQLLRTD